MLDIKISDNEQSFGPYGIQGIVHEKCIGLKSRKAMADSARRERTE